MVHCLLHALKCVMTNSLFSLCFELFYVLCRNFQFDKKTLGKCQLGQQNTSSGIHRQGEGYDRQMVEMLSLSGHDHAEFPMVAPLAESWICLWYACTWVHTLAIRFIFNSINSNFVSANNFWMLGQTFHKSVGHLALFVPAYMYTDTLFCYIPAII